MDLTDEDLAMQAQKGDRHAFLELVNRNYGRCFRLAVGIMHNHDDAEDQVQAAFLRALQHIDQFRYDAKFSSWLSQILINQCRIRFRERKRTRNMGINEHGEHQVLPQIRDTAADLEVELLEQDLLNAMKDEMRLLPAIYSEVLAMRYLQHASIVDIANCLGVTLDTVKSRLFRGRMELRRRMLVRMGRGGTFLSAKAVRSIRVLGPLSDCASR